MHINGEEESTLKGKLYVEFREIKLEQIKRENPSKYTELMRNPQEYEHERWLYIGERYSKLRNDPVKKAEYLK